MHAIQAHRFPPSSHPGRPLPRHELANVSRRAETARRSYSVAGRSGVGSIGSAEAQNARWAAALSDLAIELVLTLRLVFHRKTACPVSG